MVAQMHPIAAALAAAGMTHVARSVRVQRTVHVACAVLAAPVTDLSRPGHDLGLREATADCQQVGLSLMELLAEDRRFHPVP
jgi:hypothetical protein